MTAMRYQAAVDLAAALIEAQGVNERNARTTAELIVASDAWGIGSHGLMRLPFYLERLQARGINPQAMLTATCDLPGLVIFDGHDGLGHWQLAHAASIATERAMKQGIAAVGVSRSNHCGALGLYVWPMIETGMLGIAFSNGPAVMPPWGGTAPILSTSPIAAGLPTTPPTVIDLATSAVARGKIAAKAQAGQPLPEGWAFTADGEPTTDASAALKGMLAPLGGAKGYALALMVEALTGAMVGPTLAKDVPDMFDHAVAAKSQRVSHFVIAIDVTAIETDAPERFLALADAVSESGGRLPGSGRLQPSKIPADLELNIADSVADELHAWAQRSGITA